MSNGNTKKDLDTELLKRKMIVRHGSKYILYTKDGKRVIGTYDSRKDAEERERQVNYFKNRGKKK